MAQEAAVKSREISGKSPFSKKEHNQAMAPTVVAAIQANIRRYGWQSVGVRLLAIALATFFVLFGYTSWMGNNPMKMAHTPTTFRIWPLVILFLLWIQDGHCKFQQKKYVDLYHDAEAGDSPDLVVKVDDSFNVSSLWRPYVMLPYVVMIALLAFANLGF